MHPNTRLVAREAEELESRMFQDPHDRVPCDQHRAKECLTCDGSGFVNRLAAIRRAALEQVADDHPSTAGKKRDRVGGGGRTNKHWVAHADVDTGVGLWVRWTPEQMALEDSMAPMIRELTPQQRDALNLIYWGRMPERDAARAMHVTRPAVQHLRDRALASLERAIRARYFPEEVAA